MEIATTFQRLYPLTEIGHTLTDSQKKKMFCKIILWWLKVTLISIFQLFPGVKKGIKKLANHKIMTPYKSDQKKNTYGQIYIQVRMKKE